MKRSRSARDGGVGPLELIEEATSLLRRAPVAVLASYYLGTLPFATGALYFWADMSRNADAAGSLAGASLALAMLFIWMKYWQARFCRELSGVLLNGPVPLPASGVVLTQAIFQPWSFVVMPLALMVTLPFGWCYAFFQNVTALGGGTDLRLTYRAACRQAGLWQGQNHLLMAICLLLGVVVFANLCIGAFFLPKVLKTVLGIETIWTRSNLYLLNSTFWAAMAALTHICIDPLIKTVYLLRCHYGESLASGADLLGELKEARRSAVAGLSALVLLVVLLFPLGEPAAAADAHADSDTSSHAGSVSVVSAPQLDKAIEQVIAGPEFAWRLPRAVQDGHELPGFIRSALKMLKEWIGDIGSWIKSVLEWLADILPRFSPKEKGSLKSPGFSDYLIPIMYALLAVCLSAGGIFLWRQLRRKSDLEPVAPPSPLVTAPDVGDETVTAADLPAERWSALARELLARGELRLGLRALYLASLATLAEGQLIAVARFKSNREYERELHRFAHALPEVATSFSSNVVLFERAWYGMHPLEKETVERFLANNERIVSGVRQR